MGITLQQYRASIGRWNAGKMSCTSVSPDTDCLDEHTTIPDLTRNDFVMKGPWKAHALLLLLAITMFTLPLPVWCQANRWMLDCHYWLLWPLTHLPLKTPLLMWEYAAIWAINVFKNLLLIGGVEQNPAPDNLTPEQRIQEQDEVLVELCANAPTTEVRDTLCLYDPRLDSRALERQVNKSSKSALVVSLTHLGVPGMQDYNKETCVSSLICRLQNLMPDQCELCKQRYCVKLADIPLLSCKICGQGSHDSCIMDHLKISDSDHDSLTPSKAWEQVNPSILRGVHYLCAACEENNIPAEEAGKLKKKLKSTPHEGEVDEIPVDDQDPTQPVFTQDDSISESPLGSLDQHNPLWLQEIRKQTMIEMI